MSIKSLGEKEKNDISNTILQITNGHIKDTENYTVRFKSTSNIGTHKHITGLFYKRNLFFNLSLVLYSCYNTYKKRFFVNVNNS